MIQLLVGGQMDLKNKIVLITGASSGIGEACAKMFAQHGAKLILCARRIDRLKKLAEFLEHTHHIKVLALNLDVQNHSMVEQTINQLPEDWKKIEILINNAGLAVGVSKFQDSPIVDIEKMLDTNIKGLIYVTKAVLPTMLAHNQGHIINIGSVAGHRVYPGGSIYCATKFAVNAINQGLKMDLLGTNIRVTSIDPGLTETEFSLVRFQGDEQKANSVYRGFTPLSANDIADAIFYCASRPAHMNILEMILMPVAQADVQNVFREKSEN